MENKYENLKNTKGENVFEVIKKLFTKNSQIELIRKLRNEFESLSLNEAKEIYVIYDSGFNNLDDYQKAIYKSLSDNL